MTEYLWILVLLFPPWRLWLVIEREKRLLSSAHLFNLTLLPGLVPSHLFKKRSAVRGESGYTMSKMIPTRGIERVYYSQFWVPVCGFISHLSGGLRLRNYRAVARNHKFSLRFSVFACFCGGYSNRVKRLRRLSGNVILLKGLPFRARPSQSGLPSVSLAMWGGVGR